MAVSCADDEVIEDPLVPVISAVNPPKGAHRW
jgi:hypothetical protein